MRCPPDIVRECKRSQVNAKCHVENNCVCVCRCKPGYYYDKVADECNKLHHLDCDDLCAQLDDELECSHTKETQCVYVCARSSAPHHELPQIVPAHRRREGLCVRFSNGTCWSKAHMKQGWLDCRCKGKLKRYNEETGECVPYSLKECITDCRSQYGPLATCDPADHSICYY
jgi:hypothetical protein